MNKKRIKELELEVERLRKQNADLIETVINVSRLGVTTQIVTVGDAVPQPAPWVPPISPTGVYSSGLPADSVGVTI